PARPCTPLRVLEKAWYGSPVMDDRVTAGHRVNLMSRALPSVRLRFTLATRFRRVRMKVMLVPSALTAGPRQYLTAFLVGDSVAIDAGSLGFYGSPAEQARIRHVFLTHTHLDHIASLPIFLENVSQDDGAHCPTVYAPA